MDQTLDFHIGSYSYDPGGMAASGEGIYLASINLQTGALTKPDCVAACVNPSYLAWSPGRNRLYATREVGAADAPALVAYGRTGKGQLQLLQTVSLQGELPCHVGVDSNGRFLTSAQYGSGDVTVFKLAGDGEIVEPAQMVRHSGKGPNELRQEGPHAHYAAFLPDRNLLLAVDLGLDSVIAYPVDPGTGDVDETPAFRLQTKGGAGPRHLAFLPGTGTAYLYCELNDEIYQLELGANGASFVSSVRAFEGSGSAGSAGAAIKISPDQRQLYVSGRSQSQIAGFTIDPGSKRLTPLACVDTAGIGPRDFSITPDGSFIVVANQVSNKLTSLRRDADSGQLESTGHSTPVGSPVCVLF